MNLPNNVLLLPHVRPYEWLTFLMPLNNVAGGTHMCLVVLQNSRRPSPLTLRLYLSTHAYISCLMESHFIYLVLLSAPPPPIPTYLKVLPIICLTDE